MPDTVADIRPKALAALRDGRVAIVLAALDGQRIQANVSSSRPERTQPYIVDRWADGGGWTCTCRPFAAGNGSCPHVAAVQLVTGYESAARKS